MTQRILDGLLLAFVELWMIAQRPAVYYRLLRRHRNLGFWKPHIAVPRYATEKFFWRKVIDHNPLFETATDKAAAKEWVTEQGFDIKNPKTYWIGTDAHDIPDDVWNRPIYIKGAHGWQMNIPVLSLPEDRQAVIDEVNSFIGRSHTRYYGEWAYENLPHRLIAEQALGLDGNLIEAKLYTYGPIVEQIILIRNGAEKTASRWLRDEDGSLQLSNQRTAVSPIIDRLPLPPEVEAARAIASEIGARFDHMRVDFMLDGGDIYLGELTVYNMGGQVHLNPDKLDDWQNRSWDLHRSWFLSSEHTGWRKWYAAALRRALARRDYH